MAHERRETHGEVERVHMSRAWPGQPLIWVSVHRIGNTIIDSGCSSARPVFARLLRERPVRTVLTTHEHEDHIGNHALLGPDVEVHAPPTALRFLQEGHPRFPLYRRLVWGYHEARPGGHALGASVEAAGRRFRVIPAAGHSADQVAFLDEREQALFSGDAYMGKFSAARLEEDIHTEIATLRRLAEVDAAMLFPAHGGVIPRPRAKLHETADHFESLARRAWALRDEGLPAPRIRKALLGREPFLTWFSMGEFSCANTIENLLRVRPSA